MLAMREIHAIPKRPRLVMAILIVLTPACTKQMAKLGEDLQGECTPRGIIDLEMPWTQIQADWILWTWGPERIAQARKQTWVDFGYLCVYPLFFALGGSLAWRGRKGAVAAMGEKIAQTALLMAPLDAVEKVMILRMLDGSTAAPMPQVASIAATVKFSILAVAAISLLAGLLDWLVVRRIFPQRSAAATADAAG